MKICIACGMPLNSPEDYSQGDINSQFCLHCTDQNGKIKSCQEIFQGGINFFINAIGASTQETERLVRKNMNSLPYWQDNPCKCLEGEESTNEEFQAAIKKLKK